MEYKSLFEYLNRAAGTELGKKVNQAAQRAGVKYRTQHVDNPMYKGEVMVYPTGFLDSYFGKND
jgi:hypothetical protein